MQQFNGAVALAAGMVILLGLISRRAQRSPVSRQLLAVIVGIAAGPAILQWLRPDEWPMAKTLLKEAARFALAVSVIGVAIRTPPEDFRRLLRPVAWLLTLGMMAMWTVSSALAWVFLPVAPLIALTLGAVVTPTDPVVASSVVTGSAAEETLPDRLRSTLSLESGANDGLAYLIVLLPMSFLLHASEPVMHWLTDVLLVGVLLAVGIGASLGWMTAWLMRLADHRGWVENHSLLGMTVALSLLAVASAKLAGSDGILAAFAAGMVFNLKVDRREDFEEQNVQETIAKLFSLPVFMIFGAMLPLSDWAALGASGLALAVGILLLRRPLALLISGPLLRGGLNKADKSYLGWFGPIGVAAIYYTLHVDAKLAEHPVIWHVASLVILTSIVLHGLTSGPALTLYERRAPDGQAQRRQSGQGG